jgi:hypothetical protein
MFAKSKTESEAPSRAIPNKAKELPKRAKHRNDSEDPR